MIKETKGENKRMHDENQKKLKKTKEEIKQSIDMKIEDHNQRIEKKHLICQSTRYQPSYCLRKNQENRGQERKR